MRLKKNGAALALTAAMLFAAAANADIVAVERLEKPETSGELQQVELIQPVKKEKPEEPAVVEPVIKEPDKKPAVVDPAVTDPPKDPVVVEPAVTDPPKDPVVVEPVVTDLPKDPVVVEPVVTDPPKDPVVVEPVVTDPPKDPVVVEPVVKDPAVTPGDTAQTDNPLVELITPKPSETTPPAETEPPKEGETPKPTETQAAELITPKPTGTQEPEETVTLAEPKLAGIAVKHAPPGKKTGSISGSVSCGVGEKIAVTLTRKGETLGLTKTCTIDAPDFLFDGLEPGEYTLTLSYVGKTGPVLTLTEKVGEEKEEEEEDYPTFYRGDRYDPLIFRLQQRLRELGYYTIKVDGIYGSGTERAVRLFQQVNGLKANGVANNATQQKLYSKDAKPIGGHYPGGYGYTLYRSAYYQAAVVPLQRRLRELGYYSGSADGYFGSATYRAVRNFQSRNGLPVTGAADPQTQLRLYSGSARPASSGGSSSGGSGYRLLYWGCRGDAVLRLQRALLNAGYSQVRVADGVYGRWTYDAVRAFQRDHGLSVDGIAGRKTQNALYGSGY